jgi:hypothetical protein
MSHPSHAGDLYPVEVTVENLYCYRGKHTFSLEPQVYAVLAQDDNNPARSNWLGKSTLLMVFALALTGWHTKRTLDEIITNGEDSTLVRLVLNDGAVIERSKARGKSMQVRFTPSGGKTLTQDAAADAIEKHTGLSKDNFFATSFFRQGQMNALVSKSTSKLDLIEGWLADELEPIQRLDVAVAKRIAALAKEREQLAAERAALLNWVQGVETRLAVSPERLRPALVARITKLEATHKKLKAELVEAHNANSQVGERQRLAAQADEYDRVTTKGLELRKKFDALPDESERVAMLESNKQASKRAYGDAHNKHLTLVDGKFTFDGKCPVVCSDCPSSTWVQSRSTTAEAVKVAAEAKQAAFDAYNRDADAHALAKQRHDERAALDKELTSLRATALALADDAEKGEQYQGVELETVATYELEEQFEQLTRDIASARFELETHDGNVKRAQSLDAAVLAKDHDLRIARDAASVTGKAGAQRAIQEIMLAEVEDQANASLAEAGVELTVNVVWEHETKGLASRCSTCGTQFPTSQKVKVCGCCGAARGPEVQQKLAIQLSNESGAAEDLAGIAMGIAASNWLRAHRGVRWAAVFIDEPFGKLDPHNRQALGAHIASMLSRSFSQALVVAHELATLLAMPGRILIKGGPNGSRIDEVQ